MSQSVAKCRGVSRSVTKLLQTIGIYAIFPSTLALRLIAQVIHTRDC